MSGNRTRYLYWGLKQAVDRSEPLLAEYCAAEIFRTQDGTVTPLYREHKLSWYAERIHAARERMAREFGEPLTVSGLAAGVGMSLFHFTRIFTELAGVPPHQYLLEIRLRQARLMVRDGRSVTDTSYACGFNPHRHFSRSYARRFGHPPSHAMA
jgi:transcriptional regulator GlxA family with amidase domain